MCRGPTSDHMADSMLCDHQWPVVQHRLASTFWPYIKYCRVIKCKDGRLVWGRSCPSMENCQTADCLPQCGGPWYVLLSLVSAT